MAPRSIRYYFEKARKKGFALGAFNAANLETFKAIVGAAEKMKSPVIIETSGGETAYIEGKNIVDLVSNARENTGLPIFLNLDHGQDLKVVKKMIKEGYDLIHYDGSQLPLKANMRNTRKTVEMARKARRGVLVEAEIDYITGSSVPRLDKSIKSVQAQGKYTDPETACRFVKLTQIDTLAVFVGNVHGIYDEPPLLDLDRLETIAQKVPCFLSLHGGSGITPAMIKNAIEVGKIVKINVNTELRMAYRETLERTLRKSDEVAIYKLMPPVIEAVQKVVEKKIKLFGSTNQI